MRHDKCQDNPYLLILFHLVLFAQCAVLTVVLVLCSYTSYCFKLLRLYRIMLPQTNFFVYYNFINDIFYLICSNVERYFYLMIVRNVVNHLHMDPLLEFQRKVWLLELWKIVNINKNVDILNLILLYYRFHSRFQIGSQFILTSKISSQNEITGVKWWSQESKLKSQESITHYFSYGLPVY